MAPSSEKESRTSPTEMSDREAAPLEEKERKKSLRDLAEEDDVVITLDGEIVNASGHRDQLHRQYGLISIMGLALTVDNAWVALGTSLAVSICMLLQSAGIAPADRYQQITEDRLVLSGNYGLPVSTTRS